VAKRRLHPMDDLVPGSSRASVDVGTERGTHRGDVMLVITADTTTTTSALGNSVLALARDRPPAAALRRTLPLPAAIEEWLRLEAPQQSMVALATRSRTRRAAHQEPAIRVDSCSAPAISTPRPSSRQSGFSLERSTNRHLAFGQAFIRASRATGPDRNPCVLESSWPHPTSSQGPIQRTPWPDLASNVFRFTLTGLVGHAGSARAQYWDPLSVERWRTRFASSHSSATSVRGRGPSVVADSGRSFAMRTSRESLVIPRVHPGRPSAAAPTPARGKSPGIPSTGPSFGRTSPPPRSPRRSPR